jgi:catechol 2,3-dioxygenase-like lactoylglutathione lyase family enzyme
MDAVKFHIANITAKLGVPDSTALRQWPGMPATTLLAGRKEGAPMTQTTTRLGQVAQISMLVRNVATAERFYRDTLGLPHIFTFGDLAFFDLAGIRLYTHAVGADEWRPSSHIYFLVPDIQSAYAWLGEQGVKTKGAPHVIFTDPATGTEEWLAFFEDPDGNGLALTSRVTPA